MFYQDPKGSQLKLNGSRHGWDWLLLILDQTDSRQTHHVVDIDSHRARFNGRSPIHFFVGISWMGGWVKGGQTRHGGGNVWVGCFWAVVDAVVYRREKKK